MKPKKIAIFHNFMDNIGGAEIVTLTLARELKADIYTTNTNLDKIKKAGFSNLNIISIGKIPINAPLRLQLALSKFRKLDLKNKYNFYIISGDWAISGAVNNKPNLEYFHGPINELWAYRDYVRENIAEFWQRPIFDIWVLYNRHLYKKYFKHVQKKVCNAENTKKRIKKYLKEDAVVINPPIETKKYKYKKTGNFWLSVNRLLPHKRIEMQMKAFSKLPNEKLIIIGSYEKGSRHFEKYKSHLEKLRLKNTEMKNWVDDKEKIELYANCKGLIATAKDEDFGMSPIEAMASGKLVIASNEGGYKESIINNKTGILIDNINPDKLANTIKKISKELKKNPKKYKSACLKQAKKFDTKIFIKKIKEQIEK